MYKIVKKQQKTTKIVVFLISYCYNIRHPWDILYQEIKKEGFMATKKTAKKSNAKSTTKAANKKQVKKVVQEKQVTPVDDTSKKNKIIAIIIAIIIIIALLLCLTCCNKSTDTKKLQGKVIKESDKKKKKDKKKPEEVVNNFFTPVNTTEDVLNSVTPMVFEPKTVIEYKDTIPAEITLIGNEHMEVEYLTGEYKEEGATYTDNKDGSGIIKAPYKIKLNGETVEKVDNTVIGTYVLTYKYVDNAGNISIKVRIVDVKDNTKPTAKAYGIKKDGKYVISLSEISEELSDWAEPFTNSFDEKVEKVTITDVNSNPNEVIVDYEQNKPEIVPTKQNPTNYRALYNIAVTDESDIEVVKIAKDEGQITEDYFETEGIELTIPYKYEIAENGNYVIYAKDALGNTQTYNLVVDFIEELTITAEETSQITVTQGRSSSSVIPGHQHSSIHSRNLTLNVPEGFEIVDVKAIHGEHRIRNQYGSLVLPEKSVFDQTGIIRINGNTYNKYDITRNGNVLTITDSDLETGDKHNYIYYVVRKTVDGVSVDKYFIVGPYQAKNN